MFIRPNEPYSDSSTSILKHSGLRYSDQQHLPQKRLKFVEPKKHIKGDGVRGSREGGQTKASGSFDIGEASILKTPTLDGGDADLVMSQ